jgi:hypothetical protein
MPPGGRLRQTVATPTIPAGPKAVSRKGGPVMTTLMLAMQGWVLPENPGAGEDLSITAHDATTRVVC